MKDRKHMLKQPATDPYTIIIICTGIGCWLNEKRIGFRISEFFLQNSSLMFAGTSHTNFRIHYILLRRTSSLLNFYYNSCTGPNSEFITSYSAGLLSSTLVSAWCLMLFLMVSGKFSPCIEGNRRTLLIIGHHPVSKVIVAHC